MDKYFSNSCNNFYSPLLLDVKEMEGEDDDASRISLVGWTSGLGPRSGLQVLGESQGLHIFLAVSTTGTV